VTYHEIESQSPRESHLPTNESTDPRTVSLSSLELTVEGMKQRTLHVERESTNLSPYREFPPSFPPPRGVVSRISSISANDESSCLETEGLLSHESHEDGESNDSESNDSDDMDRKPFLSALWQSSLPDNVVADIRSSSLYLLNSTHVAQEIHLLKLLQTHSSSVSCRG
jgi:hypothetical protein